MQHLNEIIQNIKEKNFQKALKLCEINEKEENKHIISNFRGVIFFSQNNLEDAEKNFLYSTNINSKFIDPINNLLQLYLKKNDLKKYLFYAKRLITIDKTNASFNYKLGFALEQNNVLEEAIKYYEECIKLNGENKINAYINVGLILLNKLDKPKISIKYFLNAYKFDQNNKVLINHILSNYIELRDINEIETYRIKAEKIDKHFIYFLFNKANILFQSGKIDDAIKIFLENKDNLTFRISLIKIYFYIGKDKEAKKLINEQKDILLKNKNFLDFYAIRLLYEGDYENGWKYYEYRNSKKNFLLNHIKEWQGEEIKNKKILVYNDQGIGDAIQFSKYILKLLKSSKKVSFLVKKEIEDLFRKDIKNLEIKNFSYNKIKQYDYTISLGSLVKFFYEEKIDENILVKKEFNSQKKKNYILKNKKLNVGLAWSGNFNGPNEPYRSIPLEALKKIFSLDINFYCLQNEIWKRDLNQFKLLNITNLGELDLIKIADIIPSLDLVISSDTSILHLSASLNKETWGLLSLYPDWRWSYFNKINPYKSLKLFRQTNFNKWDNIVTEIYSNLENKIKEKIRE